MLLPALAKARAKARTISCVNNHKTVALMAAMYGDDSNQMLPLYVMGGNWSTRFHWFDHFVYLKYAADDSTVASCPTVGKTPKATQGYNQIYGTNTITDDFATGVFNLVGSFYRCANVSMVKNPSLGYYTLDTVFGYDRADMGMTTGCQTGAFNFGNSVAGDSGPKARHDGRNVCDFIDGHAEAILPQTWAKNNSEDGMHVVRGYYSMWLDDGDGTGDPIKYNP